MTIKKFYIGQRVRIVGCTDASCAPFVGVEAVVGTELLPLSEVDPTLCHGMILPGFPLGEDGISVMQGCWELWSQPCNLEPIIPEGYKVVSWADCAWNPDSVAALCESSD